MYAAFTSQSEEDYFANIEYSKSIECILPTIELLVNIRTNSSLQTKKSCFVYAEKMDFKGLIQLRVTEKCDHRRMYITTVDMNSFHELKVDQSLHVTFSGFIENLVRLLHDCQAGKLELNLESYPQTRSARVNIELATNANGEYQLQFVELRPFKNLVHLCLPCRIAPLNVVLFYMNSLLEALQKKSEGREHTAAQLQHDLNTQMRRIEQLDDENKKLRQCHLENIQTLKRQHAEEAKRFQDSIRKATEQRHNENDRTSKLIASLQTQLDELSAQKKNLQVQNSQEHKRIETLQEELISVKSQTAQLKEMNEKMHGDVAAMKNMERKHEMLLNDARKQSTDLQEKLKKYDKAKADIIAELEAEKKISQTKRQALAIATEEISKANEIIFKQSQDLIKMKKTINWRTEVALQQERAIKEKEKMLSLRDEEIKHMQQTMESLRHEIPQQLTSMRQFANTLEQKYSEQIRALKEKLKPAGKENHAPGRLGVRRE